MPDPELLQRLARRAVELEMQFEGDVLAGPGSKMAGKKERRSQKDRAKARKLKHGPSQKTRKMLDQKSRDQKAIQRAMRKQQLEQGQAGLAGAGRGGKHKDKKRREESDRKRKHKGVPKEASIKRVADAYLAGS